MDSGSIAQLAVQAPETYLVEQRGALPLVDGRIAAEVTVRLIVSVLTSPDAAIDFGDTDKLSAFADRVIPPLLATTRR